MKKQFLYGKEKARTIVQSILYPFSLLFGLLGKTIKLLDTKKRKITACILSFTILLSMMIPSEFTVFASSGVATINGVGYPDLQAAFDAVKEGETVMLQSSITLPTGTTLDDGTSYQTKNNVSFTLDLNGKTISGGHGQKPVIEHSSHSTLTIQDSGTNGIITSKRSLMNFCGTVRVGYENSTSEFNSTSKLVVKSGTIENTITEVSGQLYGYAIYSYISRLDIQGGNMRGTNAGILCSGYLPGDRLIISGGVMEGAYGVIGDPKITSGSPIIKGTTSALGVNNRFSSLYTNAKLMVSTSTYGTDLKGMTEWDFNTFEDNRAKCKYITFVPVTNLTLKIGENGEEIPYYEFYRAVKAATDHTKTSDSPAILTLKEDITDASTFSLEQGNMTLDTNGKLLKFENVNPGSYSRISIYGGNLSIIGKGTIEGESICSTIKVEYRGTLNLTDATIKGYGAAVEVYNSNGVRGVFNMNSGTLESSGGLSLRAWGTVNIYSGTLIGYGIVSGTNNSFLTLLPKENETILIQTNRDTETTYNQGVLCGTATVNGKGTVIIQPQNFNTYNGIENSDEKPESLLKMIEGTLIVDLTKAKTNSGFGAFSHAPSFDANGHYKVTAGANEVTASVVTNPVATTYTGNKYVKIETRNNFDITLNTDGGSYVSGYTPPVSYNKGVGAALPTEAQITKEGHTFLGWTTTDLATDTAYVTTISTTDGGDKTYYAKWKPIQYTLTINYNYSGGGVIEPPYIQKFNYGENYSVPSPNITGYKADTTTVTGTLLKDTVVNVMYTANTYALSFNLGSGASWNSFTPPANYTYDSGQVLPTGTHLSKEGYTFAGWTATNSDTDVSYLTHVPTDATGSKVYFAKWQINQYTLAIHYQFEDKTTASTSYSAVLNYGEDYSQDSPVITGYTADKTNVSGKMGAEDVTIIVKYIENGYDLKFKLNDGSWNDFMPANSYKFGQQLTLPTASQITRDGYRFLGWTASNDASDITYILTMPADAIDTVTYYAKWQDVKAPEGDITIKGNTIKQVLHNITFGLFFKNNIDVHITAHDNNTDDVTIEYVLSEVVVENTETLTGWIAYDGKIPLAPNNKAIVYAKLTDSSGNVSIIGSDGIVMYTNSTAVTTSVTHTRADTSNADITVNLNGNTIKDVKVDEIVLTRGIDYVISDDLICISPIYLDSLLTGNYTIEVSFNPLGETGTPNGISELPNAVTIPLVVSKATSVIEISTTPSNSTTRPGSVSLSSRFTTGGTSDATVQFKANGKNIGAPVQIGQDVVFTPSDAVNNYTFSVEYSGDNNYLPDTDELTFTFEKSNQSALTFDVGTPTELTYGDADFIVSASGGSGTGTTSYFVDGPATISGNTVHLTGAGTVKIRATKEADNDYNEIIIEHTITVNPKEVTIMGVTATNKTYDGNTTATVSGTPIVSGKVGSDDVGVKLGTASFVDKKVGNGKTVSFLGFALTGTKANNYILNLQPAQTTANITAKTLNVNVSIADKFYNGLKDASINATDLVGVVSGDDVSVATSYPTVEFSSVNVGNGIAIHITGNFELIGEDANNYILTQPTNVTGNIVNNYNAVKGVDYTTTTTNWSKNDFVIRATAGHRVSLQNHHDAEWTDTLTQSEETSNGVVNFFVKNKDNGFISNVVIENYKIDKTAPTGDIETSTSSIKKAFNAITFGLFFKETQSIIITSFDNGSGIASEQYILSSTILDEDAVLAETNWIDYSGTFTIEPDNQIVIYVKITDTAGNAYYFGSDGLVIDGTAPVISGAEDEKSYCEATTITVTDASLDKVTLDGEEVTLTEGTIKLSPTGKEQTIIASDKSGNVTTVIVTVNNDHTWKSNTCIHCGKTRASSGGGGSVVVAPPIIINGVNGLWKQGESAVLAFRSDAPFSDFKQVLVNGNVISTNHYVAKSGSIIVSLKPEYLATLPVGTHTIGIESVTGIAYTKFTIEAKETGKTPAKDSTPSPQTGDSNNLILWAVVLFISGSTLTILIKRKRKSVK